MSTEIAGGGQVRPTALRVMESGIRRVLAKVGALSGEPPPAAAETRIMQVRGQDYYVYALDPGLFEPLAKSRKLVECGANIIGRACRGSHEAGHPNSRPDRVCAGDVIKSGLQWTPR